MRTERRGQQNLDRAHSSPTGRSSGKTGSTTRTLELNSWARIGLLAKKKEMVFNNLFSHLNVENLHQAFRALDGKKALGIDGISKAEYAKDLDINLRELMHRLHAGTYRPQAKREIQIPKADGKTRPIAISCFEDKLVEWTLGKILESVYEPIFIRNSFGFRPRRGTDDAIKANYNILKDNKRPFVVEIDLAKFFNTVPHRTLMKQLRKKIRDPRLLGLIARFLAVDILDQEGTLTTAEVGTPQGSVMSPILANIYLHYALDTWFLENYASTSAVIVRYADDAIFMFSKEQQAIDFLEALKAQLAKYKLSLNEDKTGTIDFTKGKENVFHFLGFTFYWNHQKKGWRKSNLVIKTQVSKLIKKIQEFTEWLKANRSRMNRKKIWSITAAKLRGHYNYYGYYCNRRKLMHYYHEVIGALFKWLNRRSQRKSFTYAKFKRMLKQNPLPLPAGPTGLKKLGWSPYVK
jgi:group II intron reverse transcriptase/maturase